MSDCGSKLPTAVPTPVSSDVAGTGRGFFLSLDRFSFSLWICLRPVADTFGAISGLQRAPVSHSFMSQLRKKKKLANDRGIVRSDLLDEDACEADKGVGEGMPPWEFTTLVL